MEIITLTQETCRIKFNNDELLIFEKSLLKVDRHFTVNDFDEIILGISKDDAPKLAQIIGGLINREQPVTCLETDNQLIHSIQSSTEGVVIELTYKSILGLRSVLNQVCHGGVPIQDFQVEIGFKKAIIFSLLDSLHSNVVEKMQEGRPELILFKEVIKIDKIYDLESVRVTDDPKISSIKKACILILGEYRFSFFLGVLKQKPPIYGMIQFIARSILCPSDPFFKSNVQGIRYYDLIYLVAYLELALNSTFNSAAFETFTLDFFNSAREPLLETKIVSKTKWEEEEYLKIRLRVYSGHQGESKKPDYLEIQGTATMTNVQSFTSSIRDFLSELPRKEIET